ncbi:MAG: phenylacetate--CoA ligase family protein [Spartobacteria bacterium]|nr:phenylacetate--CoA ligase family protein [Spartobacteria bacterium]
MTPLIHDAKLEFQPRPMQNRRQAALLHAQLTYTLDHSPFYRQRIGKVALPTDFHELKHVMTSLPVTTRSDLEQHNDCFVCCPPNAVRDIVCTSGTTGTPIALPMTARDLEKLAVTEWYTLDAAGVTKGETILLCVTMDALFMAGMAYYLGAQRRGCSVLRQGAGSPAVQVDRIRRFGVTTIFTVPSFLLAILKEAEKRGLDTTQFPLRKAILVGDPVRTPAMEPNAVARQIHALREIELYGNYGNTEMGGSFSECHAAAGNHIHPDLVYAEILRDDGTLADNGEEGELVITPLQTEGSPLIRYRTGDVAFVTNKPCACGRLSSRLSPILARKNQMIKMKGTKLYPQAVRDVINTIEDIHQAVLVAEMDEHMGEKLTVLIAANNTSETLRHHIQNILADAFRVRPYIEMHSEETIMAMMSPPGYRKKRWFIDRRNNTPIQLYPTASTSK